MAQSGFLVVDANVLVDYQAADLAILALVNRYVGTVHILTTMLVEVEGLDESDCERSWPVWVGGPSFSAHPRSSATPGPSR